MPAIRRHTGALTRRQRVAAIALTTLAACFITLDIGGSGLQTAHGGVRGVLGSLYRGTDAVLGPVRRFVQGVPHAGSDASRVRALEQQNAQLQKELTDTRLDRNALSQLRRLRIGAASAGLRVLPARVVATSAAGGFDYTVTIDKGANSGVRAGQTVTAGVGLVGRVLHADPDSAVVLLAIDPGSGVGARDLRSRQLGVSTGAGRDGFTFRPLDPAARIRVGDTLSTGPARSSSYAPGLQIGTVRTVRASADGTTIASVEPTVSASSLDIVGVVVGGHPSPSDLAGGP
ncbi:MAG: rod shape-determining protein MreC [Jatrophihabitantaceae bacterium]